MPSFDDSDDVYGATSSRFLSIGSTKAPRKSPSRQSLSIHARRSTASLRGSSLAQTLDDDAANGRHSLAHELAVALMPEPSAGSKLLAEEFGIEYDEGAEGIDEGHHAQNSELDVNGGPSFRAELELGPDPSQLNGIHDAPPFAADAPADIDPVFESTTPSPKQRKQPEQDPMVILAQDLEYTEKFLSQLRRLDADHGGPTAQPTLETLASDMIRRINDTVRDREGQVRELLEYEREFRRIAGEVGGNDVLGQLDELEDLIDEPLREEPRAQSHTLDAIQEESTSSIHLPSTNDWEVDPEQDRLGEEDEDEEDEESVYYPQPTKTEFPPPPPLSGPPTPANTIPQLVHLRTFTSSAATSLATISEHTQVNAAATTEAGRKIRALKNKLGGWRVEWDSAERSRVKIDKWEAGIDIEAASPVMRSHSARRIDGRKLVQEHLQAFEKALMEANMKTQAIMTSVAA
ncbi:hypothetical protein BKA93DRAFT_723950 [Sparassis latifolia]|uniref:Uncharacterized protein n=1 Tax=Sparassis crispa TaxID=139825 RepID=A0A401H5D5_9APHY|nr:predicted protein [Sparassis crispa]GBE89603.1 predicted protein [Sparassis crispa]